ncbi:MAG: glycoside hydrolase family 26 protein [Prevotella sp.]|jgi:mannan endo-1,4-beta-mannosidase
MKTKKIMSLLMVMLISTIGATAKSPARKLLNRLKSLQRVGIMVGHQDDPVYGTTWKWDEGRSDVKDVCGDYPAVMGFELGSIELGQAKNLDNVPFDRMRREIMAQHERGGIVTLSWHPWNPVTGKNAWDPTGNAVSAVLPGGDKHELFNQWLDIVANFLDSLRTPDGKRIPVIFRPWHEMSGDWFWWGKGRCTDEEYRQLFRYTYDRLVRYHHLDNLVWCYSPNGGVENYLERYPGDKYIDLLGIDFYDFDADDAKYTAGLTKELNRLTKIGKEHKKLVTLSETGSQRLPNACWFTQVLWPVIKNYPLSYVLFWRNAWDNPKEMYMAAPGHATAPDFRKFYEMKHTLFINDIRKYQ